MPNYTYMPHPPNTFKRFTNEHLANARSIDRSQHSKSPIVRRAFATATRIKEGSPVKRTFSESESDSDADAPLKRRVTDWNMSSAASRKRLHDDDMDDDTDSYKRAHYDPEAELLPKKLEHVHIDNSLQPIVEETPTQVQDSYSVVDLETGELLQPIVVLDAQQGALVPYKKHKADAFTRLRDPHVLDDILPIPHVPACVFRKNAIYGARAGWQMVLYEPPLDLEDLAIGRHRRAEPGGYIRELEDDGELADAVQGIVEPAYTVTEPEDDEMVEKLAMMDLD